MIKTLWFFTKAAFFVAGSIWLISQPGEMNFDFLGYDIKVQTGVFLLALTVFILISFYLLRLVRAVFLAPKKISNYKDEYQQKVGYLSLTRGLVAVASGDVEQANYHSKKASKFLKNNDGLPLLLQAQAARLRGEEGVAQNCFEGLLENKDTAFLGVRGLMKSALDSGDNALALKHAHAALKLHPKQAWVLKMVYTLEIKNGHWEEALKVGKQIEKLKALPFEKIISDRIAIYLMYYDQKMSEGEKAPAIRYLKMAYKLNAAFIPTVIRLAHYYVDANKRRKAVNLIETAWKENPHPELADIWNDLSPRSGKNANTKRLAWLNKLVDLNKSSVESYVAAAKIATEMEYWGEAKAYLMAAEKLYPTAEVFHLRAVVEKNMTHSDDTIEDALGKAVNAMPAKTWTCIETGMVYSEWSAIAMPHESFNTIVWDAPQARSMNDNDLSMLKNDNPALLIDPAA